VWQRAAMPAAMRSPAAGFSTPPSHRTPQTSFATPSSGLRSPAVGGTGGLGVNTGRLPALLKWTVLLSLILGMAMALSWMQPAGDASIKVRALRHGGISSIAEQGCGALAGVCTGWPGACGNKHEHVKALLASSCLTHVQAAWGAGSSSAEAVGTELHQSRHGAG
jgi:hypothetical protein